MHPHFEEIWRWHNVEEVEHKAVTMDVWNSINGKPKTLHLVMIFATIIFWYTTIKYTVILLHADKQLWKWRNLLDAWDILFSKNGMIRSGFKDWLDFFKKDYHPNDHDDTKLLRNYRKL
jgi:predicted metal-dependent hydrolase